MCIAVLAMQVFLDTYATEGVRQDLAEEALTQYSPDQFERRLSDENLSFIVAEIGEGVVGFAELNTRPSSPPMQGSAYEGLELVRLYIQPSAQRAGLGRRLLHESELLCERAGSAVLWLTAWSGNTRAVSFYKAMGFDDVGASTYTFQEKSYANRVLVKAVGRTVSRPSNPPSPTRLP